MMTLSAGMPFSTSPSTSAWMRFTLACNPASSSLSPGLTGIETRSIHEAIFIPPLHVTADWGKKETNITRRMRGGKDVKRKKEGMEVVRLSFVFLEYKQYMQY